MVERKENMAAMVNHWGKWVDTEVPTTGVISFNAVCQFVSDEICGGDSVDLSWEAAKEEFIQEYMAEHEGNEPDDEALDQWSDEMDGCESGDTLIGDWLKDNEGLYYPDPEGEYAAIVREDVVQVVFSKYVTGCKNLCSPCYPGQADVNGANDEPDSNFKAYNLPPEAYTY